MPNKSLIVNYSDIQISFIPNPQYIQIDASKEDKALEEGNIINILSNQILKLEIFKSYETGLTEVMLYLDMMEATIASTLSEGKYIIKISIAPTKAAGDMPHFVNYFLCDWMKVLDVKKVFGTLPMSQVQINLKSILRQRLEIENHFAFELGGKGGTGTLGAGMRPFDFLTKILDPKFSQTYSPEDTTEARVSYFNLGLMSINDQNILVQTGPSMGYKMEANNNLEVLSYFFDNYPIVKTPYTWLLDDFSTETRSSADQHTSEIRVLDLLRYDAWASNFDPQLSKYINNETETTNTGVGSGAAGGGGGSGNNISDSTSMYRFTAISISHMASYFNIARYMFRDNNPLIFAQRTHDSAPLDMSAWNDRFKEVYVLTSSPQKLRVKKIKNPMYHHYITFMSPAEIIESQKYLSYYASFHPLLMSFTFTDIPFGAVDIHKSVLLKKERLGEYNNYGFDKMGIGYQVKHVFEPFSPNPALQEVIGKIDQKEKEMFSPRFKLVSEVTFLLVDTIPTDLVAYDAIEHKYSYTEEEFTTAELTAFDNIFGCTDPSGGSLDMGQLPVAEPGSPGNENILASAKTLIDHGFKYVWGGLSANGMDCSAFTMYSVQNSGADAGRATRYPRNTSKQINWLKNPKNGAQVVKSVDDIQPGDIVFFKTSRCGWCHTAIAIDKNSYYHSNSVNKKGADIGSFSRRRPAYIFRLMPMSTTSNPPSKPQTKP